MKVEIPEFKRCCFCIPLRYGLIVWGYIKLVLTVMTFLFGALILQLYTQLLFVFGYGMVPLLLAGMSLLLFLMVDIGMTIVFLIGGHGKTTKLMKIFYIYSIVLWSIIAVLLFISIVYDLSVGDDYSNRDRHTYRNQVMSFHAMVVSKVVAGVTFLGVQAYTVLLIRSEINKLCNGRNFRFSNLAAEAECTMENKNIEPGCGTIVPKNELEDCDIAIDEQFEKVTKPKIAVNKQGTFNYDQF